MNLILNIRILAGWEPQQFVIPLDLAGPATLTIIPGAFGMGNEITIIDVNQELRAWYAYEIVGLHYAPAS